MRVYVGMWMGGVEFFLAPTSMLAIAGASGATLNSCGVTCMYQQHLSFSPRIQLGSPWCAPGVTDMTAMLSTRSW